MPNIQMTWPEGKSGALTFSYDDGVKEDRQLTEILNRFGVRCTWNLNSFRVAESATADGSIAWPELKTLFAGHEVAVHGSNHPFLERLPEERVLFEIMDDRRRLEAGAGYPVKGMSLPYGTYDDRVLRLLAQCGIVHCRTTRSTAGFAIPENFLEWHPTCHHNHDLTALWQKFSESKDTHKLFYLWGHSYEFPRNNNWNVIEGFCATAKAAADAGWLWCATNMEIYSYVTAWRGLWCSLDGTSIRNPSATPVWFKAGNRLVRAGAGETVTV